MSRAPSPAGLTSGNERIARHNRGRVRCCANDLDAVFAGVAGARDQHRHRVERRLADGEARGRLPALARQLGDDANRLGSLQRDERRALRLVDDLEIGGCVSGDPREVRLGVGGVGDDEVLDVAGVVDDEVVDDVAVVVEHQRVLRLAQLGDLVQVVGEQALQEVEGSETEDSELGHVADVENARRRR